MEEEARQVAFALATMLRQGRRTGESVPRPACIVVGGETTVFLVTDGEDGPTGTNVNDLVFMISV